jgi:hypothetical protein
VPETQDTEKLHPVGRAWDEAAAAGIDMSLVEFNLRLSPAERIRAHARALALAEELRSAMLRRQEKEKSCG